MTTDPAGAGVGVELQGIYDGVVADGLALVVEMVVYGFYASMVLFSTTIIARRGDLTRCKTIMLTVTILMFAVASCHAAFSLWMVWTNMRLSILGEVPPDSFRGIVVAWTDCLPCVNFMLNDAVVMWRARLLSRRRARRWIMICGLLTLATLVGLMILILVYALDGPTGLSILEGDGWQALLAAYSLTLFTNLWTTGVIGYETWIHRRVLKNASTRGSGTSSGSGPGLGRSTAVSRMLALLIESGVVYCFLLIVYLAMSCVYVSTRSNQVDLPFIIAYSAFASVWVCLAGMYPTTILLLASLQSTLSDNKIPAITIASTSASTTLPTLNLPPYAYGYHPDSNPMIETAELRRGTGSRRGMGTSYRMERLTAEMDRDGDGEGARGSMSTYTCDLEGGRESKDVTGAAFG
ncbi:uncharacterized protein STEHIDRAFT_153296 [Stereum hirsutum FP-91666 SS1]|uniref:uncharacterized protein n=1 Tax=Stereum hirsutum (strain FP-91666) TaxID=721885 RepID=UPI000440ACD9|nr:uncharacterized protein STEHIDRAFT_153296 [Stereum hirsutum FP-91666 SS1]EIM91675.1 hypothetical protein STEHIDRAFT_153296 [Stereum hirsutum FP-91666 SS1]